MDKKLLRAAGIFCLFIVGLVFVRSYPGKEPADTSTPKLTVSQTPVNQQQKNVSPQPRKSFQSPPRIVNNVNFEKELVKSVVVDGAKLYTLVLNGTPYIRVFNIAQRQNPKLIETVYLDGRTFSQLTIDHKEKRLYVPITLADEKKVVVFDIKSKGKKIGEIDIPVYAVKLMQDKRILLGRGQDGNFYAVNVDDYEKVSYFRFSQKGEGCSRYGYMETIDVLHSGYVSINRSRGFCGSNKAYNDKNWLFKVYLNAKGIPQIEFVKQMPSEIAGELIGFGDVAYKSELSLFDNNRSVVDISDPENPERIKILKSFADTDASMKIGLWNNELLVALDDGKFDFYELSQKSNPKLILSDFSFSKYLSALSSFSSSFASAGEGYVYLANGRSGIAVIYYGLD